MRAGTRDVMRSWAEFDFASAKQCIRYGQISSREFWAALARRRLHSALTWLSRSRDG